MWATGRESTALETRFSQKVISAWRLYCSLKKQKRILAMPGRVGVWPYGCSGVCWKWWRRSNRADTQERKAQELATYTLCLPQMAPFFGGLKFGSFHVPVNYLETAQFEWTACDNSSEPLSRCLGVELLMQQCRLWEAFLNWKSPTPGGDVSHTNVLF